MRRGMSFDVPMRYIAMHIIYDTDSCLQFMLTSDDPESDLWSHSLEAISSRSLMRVFIL